MARSPIRHLGFCPRILHGAGAVTELSAVLDPAAKYLLVTDPGVAAAGLVTRVGDLLERSGLSFELFDRVRVDPDVAVVEDAVVLADRTRCSAVIGLGGGSSLDAAKAVAARLAWKTPLVEYGAGTEVPGPIAPLIAIPTTAGTGSEATRVAVITDPDRNEKMALRGHALLPRIAVLDPDLLASLPPRVAAECGADALTHAIEAYVSKQASAWTDVLALDAIRLIGKHLADLVADRGDVHAAGQMLLASNLAGQAFTHAGLGLVHSLGEPLGAFHHTSHGLSCALFLPVVMEFNLRAADARYAEVASALGGGDAVAAVRELFAAVRLPTNYAEAGVEFELLPGMLDQVFPQFSTRCNPRTPERDDVIRLFEALA